MPRRPARRRARKEVALVPVVLDTDIGTDIDDTWALAMLLRCPELDLRLVTASTGDPEYRARLVAGILDAGGRSDVPVALGVAGGGAAGAPQQAFAAGIDLAGHPGGVRSDGAAAIIDCVNSSADPVTILSIGPAGTVAAALAADPGIAASARFVGMHGSVRIGYGAGSAPEAEYNVLSDVPAFRAVLAAPWEVTITPLDTCGSVVLRGERYASLHASQDPLVRAVMLNYRQWLEAVGQIELYRERTTTLFDTVAVYLAYAEDLVDIEELDIVVDDDGRLRVDPEGRRLRAATAWHDPEAFADHVVQRLTGTSPGPVEGR
ncbi:MAG TPA: nucleoside hydrolase [Acidimicrobiales bacterium]|nr:nucleoside hydrolase [Acidimicrobiales bacterium]